MKKEFTIDSLIKWIEYYNKNNSIRNIENKFETKKEIILEYLKRYSEDPFSFLIALAYQDLSLIKKPIEDKLFELLILEKNRRNYNPNKILFLGMANLANYYWCAMRSYYRSKEEELLYFHSYLNDRIIYCLKLGLPFKFPTKPNEILEIGNKITYNDVEKLLEKRNNVKSSSKIRYSAIEFNDDGTRKIIINPDLKQEQQEELINSLDLENVEIVDAEDYPKALGRIIELEKNESYPTIRWNFEYENYIVVGVPDGITKDFVYEFKTTGSEFLLHFVKPIAFMQADLYGYFFERKMKRIQIHIRKTDEIKTWEEEIKIKGIENLLKLFREMEEGKLPKPPKKWKCKNCDYRSICELYVV